MVLCTPLIYLCKQTKKSIKDIGLVQQIGERFNTYQDRQKCPFLFCFMTDSLLPGFMYYGNKISQLGIKRLPMNRKHMIWMVLMCLLPITVIGITAIFHIPINTLIYGLLFLLCPFSHILMMRNMDHHE